MLGVVDYGVGNLFSLSASLRYLGVPTEISADKDVLAKCDRLILPGVGAFGDAAKKLRDAGLDEVVKQVALSDRPILGVCLGMQLLFEKSYEYGEHAGLALLPGVVSPLADRKELVGKKIPQMGWNSLVKKRDCPILSEVDDGEYFYYVHSFYADGESDCCDAYSDYGIKVAGVVRNKNVYGTQFHPEKSGDAGLRLLAAFTKI
ncbi:MAG: imidazole glycerol phosphate synthase subunit HisH [Clostridia bacterium]|nr:imidazole glycerol phosphate synthase subunit HisH [Clostridia bacterium]